MIYVKKLLATCAAIALAATNVVSLSAFADPAGDTLVFSLTTDKTEYKIGDFVHLTLRLDSNPGVNAWKVLINYDDGFVPVSENVEEFVTVFPDSDDGTMVEKSYVSSATGKTITTKVNSSQFGFSPSGTTKPFVVLWSDFSKTRANVLGPDCSDKENVYNYTFTGNVAELIFKVTDEVTTPNHKFTLSFDNENPAVRGTTAGGSSVDLNSVSKGDVSVTVDVPEPDVAVTGIESERGTVDMAVGSEATLRANVLPENATNKKLNWSSADTSIATVDANGNVKGVGVGQTTITVSSDENPAIKKEITVTVSPVDPESISLTLDKSEIYVNETATATAAFSPANTTDKSVAFASDNEAVATVDQNGKITGLKAGKAKIRAYSPNFKDILDEKEITVHAIKLDEETNSNKEVEVLGGVKNDIAIEVSSTEGATIRASVNNSHFDAVYDPQSKKITLIPKDETVPTEPVTVTVEMLDESQNVVDTIEFKVDFVYPSVTTDTTKITVPVGGENSFLFDITPADFEEKYKDKFEVRYFTDDATVADIEVQGNKFIVKGVNKGTTNVGARIVQIADLPEGVTEKEVSDFSIPVTVTKTEFVINFAEKSFDIKTGASKQLKFVINPDTEENQDTLARLYRRRRRDGRGFLRS